MTLEKVMQVLLFIQLLMDSLPRVGIYAMATELEESQLKEEDLMMKI